MTFIMGLHFRVVMYGIIGMDGVFNVSLECRACNFNPVVRVISHD
jgi:hypothetical protein